VLLVQRRDNGRWEPPGGVLELGETITEGLKREIREETGVDVAIVGLTGAYKNMRQGIVALVFLCRSIGEPAAATEEAAVVAWQPISEVGKLLTPAYAVRISDAIDGAKAMVRAHDGRELIDEDTNHEG
jgi:ADP-ribose pyrophosphatase YjhB (NUDIX family)